MGFFKNQSVHTFSDLATRGRGFMVGKKRFVHHSELTVKNSAVVSITVRQKLFVLGFFVTLLGFLVSDHYHTLLVIIFALTFLYFLDLVFNAYVVYRTFRKSPELVIPEQKLDATRDWPLFTIFCPLYKEVHVLPQFVEAIQALDYPKDKLQVLLLLEQDDTATIRAAKNMGLPPYISVLVVPHSLPKTKPKAMNYGLGFAKGEYVVVYDAEDKPEAKQLKKAVCAFEQSPQSMVCVQAKLNFYNPTQNILTRLFTAEYSLWFDLILPGLQSLGAPLPLGGTSNSFRLEKIKELGGWDAYNVTEDCDLGIRLAKNGFTTSIVDSTTYEEANSNVYNWYRQRSRWIKGYMQTYLVHMRHPKDLGITWEKPYALFVQLTVGGKVLSMFINPLLWVVTILYFLFRGHLAGYIEPYFPPLVLYIGVFSLIFGNFLYLYSYMIGLAKREKYELIPTAFIVPLYWLGMSVAAWKALYELIVAPHYWQKTQHGLHLQQLETIEDQAQTLAEPLITAPATPFLTKVLSPKISSTTTYPVVQPPAMHPRVAAATSSILAPAPRQSRMQGLKALYVKCIALLGLSELSGGIWLVLAMAAANALNFLFSAVFGRTLAPEDFGTLTLFTIIIVLFGIFAGSLGGSVTYRVSRLLGRKHADIAEAFVRKISENASFVGLLCAAVWIALAPLFASFFNIENTYSIVLFAPVFPLMISQSVWSGFLRGKYAFTAVAIAIIVEPIVKIIAGATFNYTHFSGSIYFATGIGVAGSWFASRFLARRSLQAAPQKNIKLTNYFPTKYYKASVLAAASSTIFLTTDVLLVKHYFDPSTAGSYALLSLAGNMIFYLCSLPSTFITSVVSRAKGQGLDVHKKFYPLFRFVLLCASLGFVFVGVLGRITIPLLFGSRALAIVPFLLPYAFALSILAIVSSYISYRLAQDDYSYAWFGVLGGLAMICGIVFFHGSVAQVVSTVLTASMLTAISVTIARSVRVHGRFLLRNITDFLDIFAPLPLITQGSFLNSNGKRILIFNWRDTRHVYAGGAENYVHELAKRWVASGNKVTVFCGSDGQNSKFETIDGVHIIRRGGFYMVYVWAVVYYFVRLRGKFDIIIDSDSALPFFTPLYVTEPVVGLVHHVHQNIFKEHLSWPKAKLAMFLEHSVMPFVYRHTKLLTVSNSTKRDMERIGLVGAGIEIVNPGVDLTLHTPGEKSEHPLVVYLGRLKAYKSVDTLIRAFELIKLTNPSAYLVVAGGGEEQSALQTLATTLGLQESVEFLGKISDELKQLLLQRAWVFANPSTMEGWGITSIEANACGTPVVASNVPGLRDSVQNPHTGYLVEKQNPAAFAEKINLLLQDGQQRQFMEHESIAWAQQFDWDVQAEKALEIVVSAK